VLSHFDYPFFRLVLSLSRQKKKANYFGNRFITKSLKPWLKVLPWKLFTIDQKSSPQKKKQPRRETGVACFYLKGVMTSQQGRTISE
jgi:hypothetical protein